MTSRLRGAVTGFGRMGMTHFSILNSRPDVDFVAICDPSSFLRGKVQKHLALDVFDSHEEMLRSVSPDFVIIATPTGLHVDCALSAIESGAHVFMEKPLAVTPSDGQTILDALQQRPVVNQIGYVLRFNDIILAIKALIDDGSIGEIISFTVDVRGPTILRDVKEGWRATKKQGGGCLHDFASHAVDLVCYLIGPPDYVSGSSLQKIHSVAVDDAVYSTLNYVDGAVGTLRANWSDASLRKPTYNLDILGKDGRIVADLHEFKIFFKKKPANSKYSQGWNTTYVTDIVEPIRFYLRGFEFTRQLDYFIDQIKNDSQKINCSFADGYQTDCVIDKIAVDAEEKVRSHG